LVGSNGCYCVGIAQRYAVQSEQELSTCNSCDS
jgi:hypothetical protein